MADVIMNLIEPLEGRFRWKDKTEDQITVAKKDMVENFQSYGIEDLKQTVMYITLHRKFSTMPTVADVRDVLERMVAERKLAEQKPTKNPGVSKSSETFLETLDRERDQAKAWARDWIEATPLGQQSLREGWCRSLHHIVWQLKLSRMRSNRECRFEDIQEKDLATQTKRGRELVDDLRANGRGISPAHEKLLLFGGKPMALGGRV